MRSCFRWRVSLHWLVRPAVQCDCTAENCACERSCFDGYRSGSSAFSTLARESGLNAKTIFGGEHKNKYLLETTGCGVAFYDYDNDGWLDIFLVNGTRLEGFPAGSEPTSHLFRNNRDGTFTDVTLKAGVGTFRMGPGMLRRRLRQRRLGRSVRHLLRQERSVSQQRRRHVHRRQPEGRRGWQAASAGTPAARSSTTTATAASISLSPTTSTWIWRPRRCLNRGRVSTRA